MRTSAIIIVGALSASPASAGSRVRASIDVSYTPAAHRPVGFGLSVDATAPVTNKFLGSPGPGLPPRRLDPSVILGGGVRLDLFTDKSVQLVVEPIGGASLIHSTGTCANHSRSNLLVDARPGLALRTRGGPAFTLAGNLEGGDKLAAHGRVGAALPLVSDPRRAARADHGLFQDTTLSVGLGVAQTMGGSCWIVGRPLREEEAIMRPDIDQRPANPIAAEWLDQARDEHAAVAAFLRLAAELELVGAPSDLVRACHQAAHDEAEHARLCLERAADHEGRTLHLSDLRTTVRDFGQRDEALRTLAAESWLDGAINEGLAALEALSRSLDAATLEDRAIHARIAVEEQAHAELGARIAAWCAEELAAG